MTDNKLAEALRRDLEVIVQESALPDGDGVTVPVVLWAERWLARLQAPRSPQPPAQDARDAWQPIETLSDAPDLVLAYVPPDEQFPTGRMMIWRRDILARNIAGPRPEHLMFPATHWMPLPKPPAMAREASDAT